MKPILLVDFGSTNTKVTAVDVENYEVLGTAAAYTTVETDIDVKTMIQRYFEKVVCFRSRSVEIAYSV